MKKRRYVVASVIAVAGFSALFAVMPSQGAGVKVRMQGNQYRPATIRIPVGGAITFANEDEGTHTATCQGQGCPRDSGDIRPRTFKTLTFASAGTVHMVCRYHGELGMVATVIVGGSSPAATPTGTPAATPTSSPSPTPTS
jgi:plastocyanin